MIPGPFAYAERWDEANQCYAGLAIDSAVHKLVTIDSDCLLVRKDIAEAHRPEIGEKGDDGIETDRSGTGDGKGGDGDTGDSSNGTGGNTVEEIKPTRFVGTVMVSADRPARNMQQIVEGIVSPLAALHGARLQLTLEIEAEVPSGLDQKKVSTLKENANTLKFTYQKIE